MLAAIGHALMMSFTMTWEILWTLILGFLAFRNYPGRGVQGRDEPKNNYWLRRFSRHFVLVAAAAAIVCLAYSATPPPDVRHRLSRATAYAGLFFLAVSLWLGPWNVLRRRPNPVSFDLHRDVSIWTGILAIVHRRSA